MSHEIEKIHPLKKEKKLNTYRTFMRSFKRKGTHCYRDVTAENPLRATALVSR